MRVAPRFSFSKCRFRFFRQPGGHRKTLMNFDNPPRTNPIQSGPLPPAPPTPRQRWAQLVTVYPWLQRVTPAFGLCEPVGTMPDPLADDALAALLAALCDPAKSMAVVEALEASIDCRIRRIVSEAVFDHEQRIMSLIDDRIAAYFPSARRDT